jgi:MFS family permease
MWRSGAASICGICAVGLISLSCVASLVPARAQEFGAGAFAMSVAVSAFSLGQLFGNPFWNRVSDSWGRKKVMITIFVGFAASFFAQSVVRTLPLFVLTRFCAGLCAMLAPIGSTILADCTVPSQRATSIAVFNGCCSFGSFFGPILARRVLALGGEFPDVARLGASIMLTASFLTLIILRETAPLVIARRRIAAAALRGARAKPMGQSLTEEPDRLPCVSGRGLEAPSLFSTWAIAIRNRSVVLLVVGYAASLGIEASLRDTLYVFVSTSFGTDRETFLPWVSACSLTQCVASFLLVKPLVRRFGERVAAWTNLALEMSAIAAASTVYQADRMELFGPISSELGMVIAGSAAALASLGASYAHPSWLAMATMFSTPESRGSLSSFAQLGNSLGRSLPTMITGALFEHFPTIAYPSLLFWVIVASYCLTHAVTPSLGRVSPKSPAGTPGGTSGDLAGLLVDPTEARLARSVQRLPSSTTVTLPAAATWTAPRRTRTASRAAEMMPLLSVPAPSPPGSPTDPSPPANFDAVL